VQYTTTLMARNIFTSAAIVGAKPPSKARKKPNVNWAGNPVARAGKANKVAKLLADENAKLRDQLAVIPELKQTITTLLAENEELWELVGRLNRKQTK
jgi:hypothetical protein